VDETLKRYLDAIKAPVKENEDILAKAQRDVDHLLADADLVRNVQELWSKRREDMENWVHLLSWKRVFLYKKSFAGI